MSNMTPLNQQCLSFRVKMIMAAYDQIVEAGFLPQISVRYDHPEVIDSDKYVPGDSIEFNIGPNACKYLSITEHGVSFETRVNGRVVNPVYPIGAISHIYARGEPRMSFIFPRIITSENSAAPNEPNSNQKNKSKPTLRIVK